MTAQRITKSSGSDRRPATEVRSRRSETLLAFGVGIPLAVAFAADPAAAEAAQTTNFTTDGFDGWFQAPFEGPLNAVTYMNFDGVAPSYEQTESFDGDYVRLHPNGEQSNSADSSVASWDITNGGFRIFGESELLGIELDLGEPANYVSAPGLAERTPDQPTQGGTEALDAIDLGEPGQADGATTEGDVAGQGETGARADPPYRLRGSIQIGTPWGGGIDAIAEQIARGDTGTSVKNTRQSRLLGRLDQTTADGNTVGENLSEFEDREPIASRSLFEWFSGERRLVDRSVTPEEEDGPVIEVARTSVYVEGLPWERETLTLTQRNTPTEDITETVRDRWFTRVETSLTTYPNEPSRPGQLSETIHKKLPFSGEPVTTIKEVPIADALRMHPLNEDVFYEEFLQQLAE